MRVRAGRRRQPRCRRRRRHLRHITIVAGADLNVVPLGSQALDEGADLRIFAIDERDDFEQLDERESELWVSWLRTRS